LKNSMRHFPVRKVVYQKPPSQHIRHKPYDNKLRSKVTSALEKQYETLPRAQSFYQKPPSQHIRHKSHDKQVAE
jgi:hypothetical protein